VALGAGLSTEVLLAMLDVGDVGVTGTEVQRRLLLTPGKTPRPDKLMVALLRLEDTGHVRVDRTDGLRFALTEKGRDRAYELGGGKPVHVQLLMADLVSFTEFTSAHGDAAARAAAGLLHQLASDAVRRDGGEVVKALVVPREAARTTLRADDLIAWSREHMAAYKVPCEVEFVTSLPKSATGKVDWRLLQEQEAARR